MVGLIEEFMTVEHVRADRLLEEAAPDDSVVDLQAYTEFRQSMLRHIAMEEKVLLPFIRAKRDGQPLPYEKSIHSDHGKIARLLVPTPTRALISELRLLLARHNVLEEGPEGLYATCDKLAGEAAADLLEQLERTPAVPMAPHYDGPLVHRVH